MAIDRIEINPAAALGRPVIRGPRILVELILRKFSEGMTEAEPRDACPPITQADTRTALARAADTLTHQVILLPTAG